MPALERRLVGDESACGQALNKPKRQYAFTHLVGKLPLTTPMSATQNVHGTGALGREPSFVS